MSGRAKGAAAQPGLAFAIRDVGGVRDLKVELQPGVNILRGRNGAGKTSTLNAITRAMGGDVPLEVRDGAPVGVVEGPGVTLSVRRVVRKTGHAEVALADCGALAQLIDPGINDSDAAAAARVRALLRLLPVPVDQEALTVLAGGDEGLLADLEVRTAPSRMGKTPDLLTTSEIAREVAQAQARQAERAAAEAAGQLQAARANLEGLAEPSPEAAAGDPLAARQARDAAIREHERAAAAAEAREVLEQRQAQIRESLGDRPDVGAAVEEHAAANEVVKRLRAELAAAEARRDELRRRAEDAATNASAWDQRRQVLDQPLEGPTADEVAVLLSQREAAEQLVTAIGAARQYSTAAAVARGAEEREKEASARAERLRAIAGEVHQRVGELLGKAGAAGLTVVNGRLAVVDGKELRDFETRLSDGERVAAALRVAATAYAGRVVPLAGEYWQALDPARRAELATLAEELGLYLVTEEPADGELRVEQEVAP